MSAHPHPEPDHPYGRGPEAHPGHDEPGATPAIHPTVDPYYAPATAPKTLGQLRVLRIGDVALDLDGHRVHIAGRAVEVTAKEFVLLRALMENAGRVLTPAELYTAGWGQPDAPSGHNDLVVYIRRLRRHIETDPHQPTRIRTVRGVGYIFDLTPEPLPGPRSPA